MLEGEIDSQVVPSKSDLIQVALRCREETGYWPISFSSPKLCSESPSQTRSELFSSIVPGVPYSFSTETSYKRAYSEAYYGVTHKKGGWDCFRHIEILQAGTVPFMPDSAAIPEFSMVHYPKRILSEISSQEIGQIRRPSVETRRVLTEYLNSTLTSEAMAQYLWSRVLDSQPGRVLFIDESLFQRPDYLSVFTLIGLKQILGLDCVSLVPVDYLYSDWKGDASKLYGRGMGYTRVLSKSIKEHHQYSLRMSRLIDRIQRNEFDLVVFGSISRNYRLFHDLRPYLDPHTTVLIYGEDLAPNEETREFLLSTKCATFVRSISATT